MKCLKQLQMLAIILVVSNLTNAQDFFINKIQKKIHYDARSIKKLAYKSTVRTNSWNEQDYYYLFNTPSFIMEMIGTKIGMGSNIYHPLHDFIKTQYKNNIWDKWNGFSEVAAIGKESCTFIKNMYDTRGRITTCEYTYPKDNQSKGAIKYDANNNITYYQLTITLKENPALALIYTCIMTYGGNKKINSLTVDVSPENIQYKYELLYDSTDQLIECTEYQKLFDQPNKMEKSKKESYHYIDNQYRGSITYLWNKKDEVWEKTLKSDLTYDDNNLITSETICKMVDSIWVANVLHLYTYNENNHLKQHVTKSRLYADTLKNDKQTMLTWDKSGNCIEKIDYIWNETAMKFDFTSKYSKIYNEKNNFSSIREYIWDQNIGSDEKWKNVYMEKLEYDEKSVVRKWMLYKPNSQVDTLELADKADIIFTKGTEISTTLNTNVSSVYFTIKKINNTFAFRVNKLVADNSYLTIYNLQGKQITTIAPYNNISHTDYYWDVSNRSSKTFADNMYIGVIKNNEGSFCKQFSLSK